ncbi:hypothetical protein [Pseudomonas sp. GL-B-19]|uniref:hypothetical protein n=1 Tax=Pseudomonas sp. GL-B-19 TaxID=2832393 RepID=UPI001CBDB834|nr:hypothetical protein [Pseudomonas sp. GL-B-19]
MLIKSKKWRCVGSENHLVVEVVFDSHDINEATSVANAKMDFINVHNPGGIQRTSEVIKNRIIAGKLADSAVLEMLNRCIGAWGLGSVFAVSEYDKSRSDNFENPDPYDLELHNKITQATQSIEVRSSFCYKLAPVEKILEKLSVYGWYTSKNKPIEPPRDWYFQVVYYLRPRDVAQENSLKMKIFEDLLESGSVTGFVVGGASKELLHEHGINRLDQDGASYRAISPIYQASDCKFMLNAVLPRNNQVSK